MCTCVCVCVCRNDPPTTTIATVDVPPLVYEDYVAVLEIKPWTPRHHYCYCYPTPRQSDEEIRLRELYTCTSKYTLMGCMGRKNPYYNYDGTPIVYKFKSAVYRPPTFFFSHDYVSEPPAETDYFDMGPTAEELDRRYGFYEEAMLYSRYLGFSDDKRARKRMRLF